jgi:hypothetical protein
MLLVSAARLRPRADHAPRTCEAQPRQRPMRPSAAAIVNGWFGVARMSLKGRGLSHWDIRHSTPAVFLFAFRATTRVIRRYEPSRIGAAETKWKPNGNIARSGGRSERLRKVLI